MAITSKSVDVAKLAGVSRATVSNVLNSTKFVSPELIERVLTAVKQLNYQPHGIARSLAVRKTYSVGFVVPQISLAFYPTIIAAAERVLAKKGYSLILCNSDEKGSKEENNLKMIMEKRVDGLLWVPCSEKNLPLARNIAGSGVPIIVVDRRLAGAEFHTITSDNYNAGRMAARYLLGRGRKRPAIVGFMQSQAAARDRLLGFKDELNDVHQELPDDFICIAMPPEYENAAKKIERMLHLDTAPDALFACSESLTLAAIKQIRAAGLRIPDDIALLGFDDSAWSSLISPPISVITQDRNGMGTTAARLLLKEIEGKKGGSQGVLESIELPVSIVERESCGEESASRSG